MTTASGQKGRSPADASRLSRTITDAAHMIITETIHRDLKNARVEAARNRRIAEESLADLDEAVAALDRQRTQFQLFVGAAAVGGTLLGGLLGAALARRQRATVIARLSHELQEMRQMVASKSS